MCDSLQMFEGIFSSFLWGGRKVNVIPKRKKEREYPISLFVNCGIVRICFHTFVCGSDKIVSIVNI